MKDQKVREIEELALFRGCNAADVSWIAKVADTVDVPAGRTLAREGSNAKEFVVLVRGSVAASNGSGSVSLAPGTYFGDEALIGDRPHSRTVTTQTQTRLLVFGPGAFRGMLHKVPSVGRKLLDRKVAYLRHSDQEPRSLRAVS